HFGNRHCTACVVNQRHNEFTQENSPLVAHPVKKRLNEDPPDIIKINGKVNWKAADMIHRMLQRDPDDRHATFSELIVDFRHALKLPQQLSVTAEDQVRRIVAGSSEESAWDDMMRIRKIMES
ncbi:MAG: hypothetical protein AAF492_04955, partial [Verrucomicrobiota bacterium]